MVFPSETGPPESEAARTRCVRRTTQHRCFPSTGGAGTKLYTAGGALLIAAACLLYIQNKRRRARRHPIEDRLFPHDESCLRPVPIWIAMLLCAAGSISIACLPFVRSLPRADLGYTTGADVIRWRQDVMTWKKRIGNLKTCGSWRASGCCGIRRRRSPKAGVRYEDGMYLVDTLGKQSRSGCRIAPSASSFPTGIR